MRDFKFVAEVPRRAGRVVSMVEFKGRVYVACERGLYQMNIDGKLMPVEFAVVADERESE